MTSPNEPDGYEDSRCARGAIVADVSPTERWAFPARCRKWACSDCGPRKARKLRRRIARAPVTALVTLTHRANPDQDPQAQLDTLNRAWRLIVKRIRRAHPRAKVRYVRVVELQQNGTPHLHIAASLPYVPQATLSLWMEELAGSPVVDIRRVRQRKRAANYLAKYLTKSPAHLPSRRVWSASPGFLPPDEKPEPSPDEIQVRWRWTPESYPDLVARVLEAGGTFFHGVLLWPAPP